MFKKWAEKIRAFLVEPVLAQPRVIRHLPIPSSEQKTLCALYRQHLHDGIGPLSFGDVGFKSYSQHEEDGILLYIFSIIGATNRRCVEICAGDGIECNTANLVINHRWIGLMFDGNQTNVDTAKSFYASEPNTRYWPPTIVRAWITRDNVNQLITDNGFSGEIDLLSLDLDGVDYWIWEKIDCISPRVVVLEINHLCGPGPSVSVPYRDDFVCEFTQWGSDYAGASIRAFVKLGRRKGYRLVGTNAIATNAFFVRDDLQCRWLAEVTPESCFDHPRAKFGMTVRWQGVKDKPWVEV